MFWNPEPTKRNTSKGQKKNVRGSISGNEKKKTNKKILGVPYYYKSRLFISFQHSHLSLTYNLCNSISYIHTCTQRIMHTRMHLTFAFIKLKRNEEFFFFKQMKRLSICFLFLLVSGWIERISCIFLIE